MKKIYVTSDTHFNQSFIILFGKRPFKNLKEMNEMLIKNWNKTVDKNDIVIIVGDFVAGNYLFCKWLLSKLNGEKILIKGNHDFNFRLKKLYKTRRIKIYNKIKLKLEEKEIVFTHKPIEKTNENFLLNIHGHYHNKLLPKNLSIKHYYNVAVEHNNYTPKSFKEILLERNFNVKTFNIDNILEQIFYNNKKNLLFI